MLSVLRALQHHLYGESTAVQAKPVDEDNDSEEEEVRQCDKATFGPTIVLLYPRKLHNLGLGPASPCVLQEYEEEEEVEEDEEDDGDYERAEEEGGDAGGGTAGDDGDGEDDAGNPGGGDGGEEEEEEASGNRYFKL
jgi:hypothetical protein